MSEQMENTQNGININKKKFNSVSWKIIKKYFDKQYLERLVRHQIESYNNFVDNQINKTIDMFNPVVIRSEHDKHAELGSYSLEIIITS